jgi:hypothetical protein
MINSAKKKKFNEMRRRKVNEMIVMHGVGGAPIYPI